jgi:hypothetical protein
MSRVNRTPLDSKAANRKIARDRNVNVSSASAKNNVETRAVAANRVVVSKAADKPGYVGLTSGGKRNPPL